MCSKEINQIHEGLLRQCSQWTQWLKCKLRLKKLIYSLMLALGRIYQEKYCPYFPAAFVSVATIYQHWSQG